MKRWNGSTVDGWRAGNTEPFVSIPVVDLAPLWRGVRYGLLFEGIGAGLVGLAVFGWPIVVGWLR